MEDPQHAEVRAFGHHSDYVVPDVRVRHEAAPGPHGPVLPDSASFAAGPGRHQYSGACRDAADHPQWHPTPFPPGSPLDT